MQQLEYYSSFLEESKLKNLVDSGKVSIVYIHGTARSGSTIAEIVLSQLADVAIHQPFRGTLQKKGGRFRTNKSDFDADIYDLACGLIVKQINTGLINKLKVTVVIKELAGFFHPYIWQRWLEIPSKFLFTIREPHLQYMSWLSAMTDKVLGGMGEIQNNKNIVIERAETTEVSNLPAEWSGNTISCNQAAWNALINDFNLAKTTINSDRSIAILDSILLRYKPEVALKNTLDKLKLNANLNIDNLLPTSSKVWDIRDKNRPMVRKANHSKKIAPLTVGEAVSLHTFPQKSQEHIKEIIPKYLKLLAASEQAYLPTLDELKIGDLITTQPFITYIVALLDFGNIDRAKRWFNSLAEQKKIDPDEFQDSMAIVNNYWKKKQSNYG